MRDALALLAGVLREACRLAVGQLGAPDGLPLRAAAVTPEWLSMALQADYPGVRVGAVVALGGDAGTTDRARVGVDYADGGHGAPPPSTLFLKMSPVEATTQLFVNLLRLGANELGFYREIAPQVPIERPRVFYAAGPARARRFVLVLEDLAARGAQFLDAAGSVTRDQASAVVRTFGRLHARFWDSPRFRTDLAWLRAPDRNPLAAVERGLCALALRPALRRCADIVPAEVRARAARVMAARPLLERAWARGPRTLLHGDAHIGNMYLLPDAVGLLDWQVVQCGQGMRDVAYFLVTSVPTELRRAHERELIGEYLATLRSHGIDGPAPDEAWAQYRLHALYAWIATVVTTAAATLQAEHIARAGLARSSAAVTDLDSVAALDGSPAR
jgi:hypothetical protein